MEPIIIEGSVIEGRRLGRTLGFPTANIAVMDAFSAPDGVYRAQVEVAGKRYRAMANLGTNPTVGNTQRLLETYLFDFEGDLYGQTLRVELLEYIRGEQKFASLDELQAQLNKQSVGLHYSLDHPVSLTAKEF